MHVLWEGEIAGTLQFNVQDEIEFAYEQKWIAAGASPLSLSLPLSGDFDSQLAHSFFANLLPEDDFRLRIEKMLKISHGSDFSLLAAIGEDCVGALSIQTPQIQGAGKPEYEKVSETELVNFVEGEGLSAFYLDHSEIRFFLVGAQGKMPLTLIDNEFYFPKNRAAYESYCKIQQIPR